MARMLKKAGREPFAGTVRPTFGRCPVLRADDSQALFLAPPLARICPNTGKTFTLKEISRTRSPKIAIFLPVIFLPSSRNQEKGKKMTGKKIVAANLHALFSPQSVAGM
jgi:hypothetical protein